MYCNCFGKTPEEERNRLMHNNTEQYVHAQLGIPSVLLGCNNKWDRNCHNFATNYYRIRDDLKCCSTCALPHFVRYLTSNRISIYGFAMAQLVICWPCKWGNWVQCQDSSCGVSARQNGTGTRFSPSISAFHQCSILIYLPPRM